MCRHLTISYYVEALVYTLKKGFPRDLHHTLRNTKILHIDGLPE